MCIRDREGIEIRIGESQKYDFEMSEAITELTTVEVVASAGNTGENAGASTDVYKRQLLNHPLQITS